MIIELKCVNFKSKYVNSQSTGWNITNYSHFAGGNEMKIFNDEETDGSIHVASS